MFTSAVRYSEFSSQNHLSEKTRTGGSVSANEWGLLWKNSILDVSLVWSNAPPSVLSKDPPGQSILRGYLGREVFEVWYSYGMKTLTMPYLKVVFFLIIFIIILQQSDSKFCPSSSCVQLVVFSSSNLRCIHGSVDLLSTQRGGTKWVLFRF